jgi:hypothetical protein
MTIIFKLPLGVWLLEKKIGDKLWFVFMSILIVS